MIRIARPEKGPARLVRLGVRQTELDCNAFDEAPAEYQAERKFAARSYYSSQDVKTLLLGIHGSKCCYCEKKEHAPINLEVEHYRPRNGFRQSLTQTYDERPGYYWLAYEWTNLLLACRVCNCSPNKGTRFPLANPRRRARSHHDDLERERPLFVNPATQHPRRHIVFRDEVAIGLSQAGRTTIEGIGLNSNYLREARRERIALIQSWINIVRLAEQRPDDAELLEIAEECSHNLGWAVLPAAEFSSMARDYINGNDH